LVEGGGYCARHAAQYQKTQEERSTRYDSSRPSSAKRGYGRRWKKLRDYKLACDPMCEVDGCPNPATEVDHITPKADGGTDDWDNLQSLCKSCHSKKTWKENAQRVLW
jgi:5-methylcytosine-specific restriction protein A